jgi:hypothetical protein
MQISEKLKSLTLRDPLAFGISYIDLLEGKHWEVASRAWANEIYQVVNPWVIEKYPVGQPRRVVVTKSTQAGISTWGMVRMFHFATNWPVRIFYTLPRQQDVLDFVTTRIDPMIKASPYLSTLLSTPDSAHAKRIGDSYLFFMELSVEPRMMPADALFVDEVDLSNPDYMSTALNRLDASRWKLSYYLSTPTLPNYGIHGLYTMSDMREWLIKCPKCNYEQPLDWEINLRVEGAPSDPTRVYYGCQKCDAEITVEHAQTGRWVAEKPGADTIGFHIHQMLTTPAPLLYAHYRDPQTKLVEFYRKRLGKPYEIGGGSLSRDDILATCFDDPYEPEASYDGKSTYFLGADQGNEIQVIIGKISPGSSRPKVVHVELIPLEKGFDRLEQLINIFKIRSGVVDANPNRHATVALTKKYPGRILIADYIEQRDVWKATKSGGSSYLTNVAINRTAGFDGLMKSIGDGEWAIYGTPPGLPQEVELLIDQVTALKRDIETRKTTSGETQVGVWRKLRADHLAHAWLYMMTAKEISRGRRVRIAGLSTQVQEEAPQEDEDKPRDDIIVGIVYLLAEVPKDQLSDYVIHGEDDDYELPFPLSYKLGKALDKFDKNDILWVIINIFLSGKA